MLLTLISPLGKVEEAARRAGRAIERQGGRLAGEVLLDPPFALGLRVAGLAPGAVRATVEAAVEDVDVVARPAQEASPPRLMLADMDSTIIGQECIDELAAIAGQRSRIAAITAAAMRGELDFAQALAARVAALAGLEATAIERVLLERVRLNPGARTLVATLKAQGCRCVLVSGGFTAFTSRVAAAAGFDRHVANRLDIEAGRLKGTVRAPIVDAAAKRRVLVDEREALGLRPAQTLAVGDGANDIPMLQEAGLGIAWRAKPAAAAAAHGHIRHGDLAAVLWAAGIPRATWVDAGSDAEG